MAAPSGGNPVAPRQALFDFLAATGRGLPAHGDQTHQAQNHHRIHPPPPAPALIPGSHLDLPPPPPPPETSAPGPEPQPVPVQQSHPPAVPPLPAFIPPPPVHDGADDSHREHHDPEDDGHSESEDEGSEGGERDNSDDDNRSSRPSRLRWHHIPEDESQPCEDELSYIRSRDEHGALDSTYWERQTFFDLDDPEITPISRGQIHWTIDRYNGTKESPNKEAVMRSQIVNVGGYDWRIKFYPKGNRSDFLSVYVENVTMQAADFEEWEDFPDMAFPILANEEKFRKRRSCAVQVSVIMYNPAEPRTYEWQTDAHQYTKRSPDYGWTHFTRHNRHDFHTRKHCQRQAILRDDRLAFVAYIQLLNDPTGCLWAHGTDPVVNSLDRTGLRPWWPQHPQFAAFVTLLHFAPFRHLLYRYRESKDLVGGLQILLWKMLSRRRSSRHGYIGPDSTRSDAISWLQSAAKALRRDTDASIIDDLLGPLDGPTAAVGEHRLKTSDKTSIQAALDTHPTMLGTPAFLTLELERRRFDTKKRAWVRLTNKVNMPNSISVRGKFYPTKYTLFAFVTHMGRLTSGQFNAHVRPNGPDGLWYSYSDGTVACKTHKQAVGKYNVIVNTTDSDDKSGESSNESATSRPRPDEATRDEGHVVQVVMYVRDDVAPSAFSKPREEKWDVPGSAKGKPKAEEKNSVPTGSNGAEPQQAELARCDTGAATVIDHPSPEVWARDPEGDVVMSDVEGDDEHDGRVRESNIAPADDEAVEQVTHDHFGLDHYKGGYLRGAYHGKGTLITTNGNQYTGGFINGQPHGEGTMIYASSGNTYTGSWNSGKHHGAGTFTEATTGNVYEGNWRHGRKHGAFVLRGTVTDDDQGVCSICYEREITTAFYDCGHVIACKLCASMVESCPVCRKRIIGRVELFGVKLRLE